MIAADDALDPRYSNSIDPVQWKCEDLFEFLYKYNDVLPTQSHSNHMCDIMLQ